MPATPSSRLLQTLNSFPRLHPLILLPISLLIYLLLFYNSPSLPLTKTTTTTSPAHLLFGISSSARTWPHRRTFLRSWWRPGITRGLVFLDLPISPNHDLTLPPVRLSANTSRFPYSFKNGRRSAIRIARVAKEVFDAFDGKFEYGEVRWIVIGDDDTVFFLENLAGVLGKYDWEEWYYVGGVSESAEQNAMHSFDMAFGGGGFAISYPLARVLARVMDSCLMRYGHLFGSDARVFACLAELGVGLTREPGFHQGVLESETLGSVCYSSECRLLHLPSRRVCGAADGRTVQCRRAIKASKVDLRGDLFGFLSTHPLPPLVSLHHLDSVNPLFPGKNHSESLIHLSKAANIDPERILQQTVCYDRNHFRTVSVSWGFSVQIFEGNKLLTDLLASQKTFRPWKRGRNSTSGIYMFNTREFHRDPCKRPAIFFLESPPISMNIVVSKYGRDVSGNCPGIPISTRRLQQIFVFSQKYYLEMGKARRRQCCDVLDSLHDTIMNINIRDCKDGELIAMQP